RVSLLILAETTPGLRLRPTSFPLRAKQRSLSPRLSTTWFRSARTTTTTLGITD
ncbi:hypothetical protein PENDEC_c033G06458, partial [Penicillium decumbens]